jgi:hypothetical protein
MKMAKYARYKVSPDDFNVDRRIDDIINEVEAANGTVKQAYDRLVAEGFEPEACDWLLKLYAAIPGFTLTLN